MTNANRAIRSLRSLINLLRAAILASFKSTHTISFIKEHVMKKFFAIVAMLVTTVSSSSAGEPKPGTFGLGWYSATAPVGGRVWLSPQFGLDLGLGLADENSGLSVSGTRIHVNVGVPINVVMTEKANFFIRPGMELQTSSRTVNGGKESTLIISADLGAEFWMTDNLTLSVGHGLQMQQVTVGTPGTQETKFSLTALRALSFTNVGFHFYF